MIIPERLKQAMAAKGFNQSRLAQQVGISSSMINKLVRGDSRNSAHIYSIARVLSVTPEFLSGDSEDAVPSELAEHRSLFKGAMAQPAADTVELQEFDVSYGMGGSYIHDAPASGKRRVFSRSWIRQFTDSPMEALFWATGNGPSMMPAILDQDILLIDTMNRTPRTWDKFWALDMHGMGMIKALRPGKEGAMRIVSINPDWPEEVAYDGEMNVVGRVVAIVRKV